MSIFYTQLNPDGKWQATDENSDGPEESPIGYGDTELEALQDLFEQYEK